jgi:hypothetical protein
LTYPLLEHTSMQIIVYWPLLEKENNNLTTEINISDDLILTFAVS